MLQNSLWLFKIINCSDLTPQPYLPQYDLHQFITVGLGVLFVYPYYQNSHYYQHRFSFVEVYSGFLRDFMLLRKNVTYTFWNVIKIQKINKRINVYPWFHRQGLIIPD